MQKSYYLIGAVIVIVIVLLVGAVILFQGKKSGAPAGSLQVQPTAVLNPTISNQPAAGESITAAGIPLSITAPANNSTTSAKTVTVKGKTAPRADVSVNNQDLKADAQGNFYSTVTLDEGDNYIDIVANDTNGNFAEQEIMVTYETGK